MITRTEAYKSTPDAFVHILIMEQAGWAVRQIFQSNYDWKVFVIFERTP